MLQKSWQHVAARMIAFKSACHDLFWNAWICSILWNTSLFFPCRFKLGSLKVPKMLVKYAIFSSHLQKYLPNKILYFSGKNINLIPEFVNPT